MMHSNKVAIKQNFLMGLITLLCLKCVCEERSKYIFLKIFWKPYKNDAFK